MGSIRLFAIGIVAVGAVLICGYFFWLSARAVRPDLGVVEGRLQPCSAKPNCVCSEFPGARYIAPIEVSDNRFDMAGLVQVIESMGGKIIQAESDYLLAEFRSRLFGFVDDLEVRLDSQAPMLHIRSGSRSGTSDFGVNQKRVESLRAALKAAN